MAPCQLFSEYPGGLWQWYNREQQEESSDVTVQSQELLSQSEYAFAVSPIL